MSQHDETIADAQLGSAVDSADSLAAGDDAPENTLSLPPVGAHHQATTATRPQDLGPPPVEGTHQQAVEVIEEGVLSTRLRRPLDLARVALALTISLLILALVWFADTATADIDQGLLTASRRIPDVLVLALNTIGGIGLLTLPVAAGVDLLVRGRGRQLLDALFGLFGAVVLLTTLSIIVEQWAPDTVQIALAGSTSPDDDPFLPLFGGLIGFVTVARLMARRPWNLITAAVVVSLTLVSFITGGITVAGIGLSLTLGWFAGLVVRYTFGTPTTRPPGAQVAATLVRAGFPLTLLTAEQSTDVGRRYLARVADAPDLHVVVLDRDLEGAGLASAIWQDLRLRANRSDSSVNMRRTLEQHALLSYAAQVGGVPAPRLVLTSEIGPDSALLAYCDRPGTPLAELPSDELTDEVLDRSFRVLTDLQRARIAHRHLSSENVILQPDGAVSVTGLEGGVVAAGDVALRIDIAELLASLAMLTDPGRALAAGKRVLGTDTLIRALPVLQRVALSPATRKRLRSNKGILNELRDGLIELRPDAEMEQIQLERVRPKTLLTIVLGSVAGYLLLSQLARVDLLTLIREANWLWALFALAMSLLTYISAAWALSGFVPEKLRLIPTVGAQFAASFATLVTPPTLGAVAINLRYLQRQGVHPALATASIGASQASAFLMHILLLLGFGIAAGTQSDFTFEPPRAAVLLFILIAIVAVAILSLPPIRKRILDRFGPLLKQIGPRLLTLVQQPRKLAEGVGGLLLLNLGYIAALTACVHAFGGELNLAAIAVVYLTGSVVGQAAPTPGGLGAVEAALAAGLTAAGLEGGLAVSAVLLFRLVTFWIPTIPGWFALNAMQKRELL